MANSCILVLDDDPSIRDFLEQILADEGYEVCTAANGREGLDILKQRHVDLVLLDLMMPVMDGWQFAEAWQKLAAERRPPVIVLTADRNAESRARTLGLATGISKPFMLDQFLDTIARYLPSPA